MDFQEFVDRHESVAAILGLTREEIEPICLQTGTEVAEPEAKGQVIVGGSRPAMIETVALAREKGATKVIPLTISIPK